MAALISSASVFQLSLHGQEKALMIIDIQDFYFPGGSLPLDDPVAAAKNAGRLLDVFRQDSGLILFVRHEYSPGGNIHHLVAPRDNEMVITKTEVNVFKNSRVDSILKKHGVIELVLCGMQTHMCLEAAARAASDIGYSCTVIEDACATRALKYGDLTIPAREVHYSTLVSLRPYALIMSTDAYLKER
ncbi:MAG: isochorismatase family protein [Bacteroidales bacterium]|nr:isochorismatase family protein [Bacteroidales bacterium]